MPRSPCPRAASGRILLLPQLTELTAAMARMGGAYGAHTAQIAVAWAIARGTTPIIGVTKVIHMEDAAQADRVKLGPVEREELERLAQGSGVDTWGSWKSPMVQIINRKRLACETIV